MSFFDRMPDDVKRMISGVVACSETFDGSPMTKAEATFRCDALAHAIIESKATRREAWDALRDLLNNDQWAETLGYSGVVTPTDLYRKVLKNREKREV